jgi:ADP-ribosylglycohydrolase
MSIPPDYAERVYAGVLGKIIGVYLGRPFEGWTYRRIMAELGEITYYVHEKLNRPLIVTDDDIAGTFTFLRALADHGCSHDLTPAQIGQTWLNTIIERRTILWWGGLGNSSEHTAFLRLKQGIPAPHSGSAALNGKTVSEQIGAQIFIDGWAMVAPGDPELAADLARRAASVSHDGEAVYGAQVIAAMESLAFVEHNLNTLIDAAVALIPPDSLIGRLIADVREWHARYDDWRAAREQIEAHYGYDKYGGGCHIVPNHALIMLSLLYGGDDFQRSLMIVNTSGWDTDCNSGNVGCLLGIKNGLAGIGTDPDWRGPIADRLYLPTADGGRAITDAVLETYHIVNAGRVLAGEPPVTPKNGARFHFELPGAVQGFQVRQGQATLQNVLGHSQAGTRSLAIRPSLPTPGKTIRVATPTFIPVDAIDMPGYTLLASPTIYSGQVARAGLAVDTGSASPVSCRLYIGVYGPEDTPDYQYGPAMVFEPGRSGELVWQVPDTAGAPIAEIGLALDFRGGGSTGSAYLDYLTWDGPPSVTLTRPLSGGTLWRRAWVSAVDHFDPGWAEPYRIAQDCGTGLLIQGTQEWTDYCVTAELTPHLVKSAGLGACVQGLRRYYALLLRDDGTISLVKSLDDLAVLASASYPWEFDSAHTLSLQVSGKRLQGWIDGRLIFDVEDREHPLISGGVALICEEGCLSADAVTVAPVA